MCDRGLLSRCQEDAGCPSGMIETHRLLSTCDDEMSGYDKITTEYASGCFGNVICCPGLYLLDGLLVEMMKS